MSKLRVLDLFSGIGGFSLGLERTGGFETVAFCEIEPFPRKVLAKHWPKVPIYDDVRTLTKDILDRDGIAVDVITGGFPCQDLSTAGNKRGLEEGTRSGLWSEIIRLTCELRPQFVTVENVSNLLRGPAEKPGKWFGRVLGDLAECGYNAEWQNIPASALGAPHRRERVWFVAYPCEVRRSEVFEHIKEGLVAKNEAWPSDLLGSRAISGTRNGKNIYEPALLGSDDGLPFRLDELAGYGNAVVPQIPELIGNAILQSMRAP